MISESQIRFSGAEWFEKTFDNHVLIVGLGGIGSWAALALKRANYTLTLFDDDIFDERNMAGQFVALNLINRVKNDAVRQLIDTFCESNLQTSTLHSYFGLVDEEYLKTCEQNIILLAVDDIGTRKKLFNAAVTNPNIKYIVDGRMTSEEFDIFSVNTSNKKDIAAYRKTLFNKSEANELPCSNRATTHNAMGIAYIITSLINNLILENSNSFRIAPFRVSMKANYFIFESFDNQGKQIL